MKNRKEYSSIIYSYDIETSKVIVKDESCDSGVNILQSTYLHGLAWCTYKPILHGDFSNFRRKCSYKYCRTYADISDEFQSINDWAKEDNKYVKIFVHNLSYEFEAMMRNIKFCIENFDQKHFIAVGTHQPLLAVFDHLEFYDSFKILECKSLETLGKEYNVPKLKEIKGGYDQHYYWWTKLPQSEITYNRRDCELTLYALCRYMAQFTGVTTVDDIMVSNTAMIKREIRNNRTIATNKEVHFANMTARSELNNNKPFLKLIQKALAGGYTHANPYIVGKHITDVYCYDATSMHPSAMWCRKFPYQWIKVDPNEFNYMAKANLDYLGNTLEERCLKESELFERPIRHFMIGTVTYKNIRAKQFCGYMYAYISCSKCDNLKPIKGEETYDNGKVVNASELTFTGCDIDFLLIDMLYDYEEAICSDLIIATKRSFITKPSHEGILYYAKRKSGFKKLEKLIDAGKATMEDFTFDGIELYDKSTAEHILANSDSDMVHTSLMASKGGLNGQYGCNAMKPIRAEVGLTGYGESLEWIDKGELLLQSKSSINIFTDGLYTVAYSRLHLICFALYISLVGSALPLYHDTDSVYFTHYSDKVKECIDKFNANILANSISSECYNFGLMDFDGHYDDFVTWGSKCYCATHDGKVKATVAGASKKELSNLFTEIVKEEGFDYLIDEYFHPNISYDSTINKKLIRSTPGTRIKGKFKDDFGVEGELDECSVTVLDECGYTLRSLKNPAVYAYFIYCFSLRGEHFISRIPETVSIKDKDYSTFSKRFSTEQYDEYLDCGEQTLFQLQHELGLTRKEENYGQKTNLSTEIQ